MRELALKRTRLRTICLNFVLVITFLFTPCGKAFCSSYGIDILSSEYHVWGNIHGTLAEEFEGISINPEIIYRDYNVTSSSPLKRFVDAVDLGIGYDNVHASSKSELFSLDVSARSYQTSFTVDSTNYLYTMIAGPNNTLGYNDAFAEATWIFKTFDTNLSIDLLSGVGPYGTSKVWLYDLTTNTEMFYGEGHEGSDLWGHLMGAPFNSSTMSDPWIHLSISADTTHEYALTMYTEAESAGDSDFAHLSAKVYSDTVSVPEPATLILIGLGLVSLAGVSRKKFSR